MNWRRIQPSRMLERYQEARNCMCIKTNKRRICSSIRRAYGEHTGSMEPLLLLLLLLPLLRSLRYHNQFSQSFPSHTDLGLWHVTALTCTNSHSSFVHKQHALTHSTSTSARMPSATSLPIYLPIYLPTYRFTNLPDSIKPLPASPSYSIDSSIHSFIHSYTQAYSSSISIHTYTPYYPAYYHIQNSIFLLQVSKYKLVIRTDRIKSPTSPTSHQGTYPILP